MENPDLRFFQMLTSLGFLTPTNDGTIEDPFYKEDDEILNAVYNKTRLVQRNVSRGKKKEKRTRKKPTQNMKPKFRGKAPPSWAMPRGPKK